MAHLSSSGSYMLSTLFLDLPTDGGGWRVDIDVPSMAKNLGSRILGTLNSYDELFKLLCINHYPL